MGIAHSNTQSNHLDVVKQAMRDDEKIKDVFEKFDCNKDGLLDRKEAKLFIQDICDAVCQAELRLSSNWSNGHQHSEHFLKKKWKYAKRHADDLFEIIDEGGTGKLGVEEVRNFLHKTDLKFWLVYFGKIGWYRENREFLEHQPERKKALIAAGLEEYL